MTSLIASSAGAATVSRVASRAGVVPTGEHGIVLHEFSNWRLGLEKSKSAGVAKKTTVRPVGGTSKNSTRTAKRSPASSLDATTQSNPELQQGVYVGPADVAGVKFFAAKTGTNVTIASDYLPGNAGWTGMDGANGSLNWITGAWKNSGYTLSLGVPIIPSNSSGQPQGSLALGASGAYDGYFTTLANTLIASGERSAYLRLGWEFDGNWYAWQAQSSTAESQYASYFRQIVTTMRAVPGAEFKFVWNPDASVFVSKTSLVKAAYPGNAYVDIVGLDLYDMNWGGPETPQSAWTNTYLPQLTAAASFAHSQNKPIAICEWGTLVPGEHGLGDDPLYVNDMIKWMQNPSHNVAYESYFNSNTLTSSAGVDQNLTGGNFPNSQATFTSDLGA
jgi:hypothetical protein